MPCNECGRFNCDCEIMTLDIYGTEIVPGEEYIEDGEVAIHKDNIIRYLQEFDFYKLKTR